MVIGQLLRSLLGPFEKPVSEAYRALFFDMGAFIRRLREWVPAKEIKILEIGCGEGMFVACLLDAYPQAQVTGIDITDRIGRMCKNHPDRVVFRKQTIEDLTADSAFKANLVTIVDVLHHIPKNDQEGFLVGTKRAMKMGGSIVIKEWARSPMPVHLLVHFLDRVITGDRVFYRTVDELRGLIKSVFGDNSIKDEIWIGPWRNNKVFLIKP